MLTGSLIALLAVVAFAVFEKVKLKTDYNFKTAWFKYVVALLLGTFFKYLTEWKYFQYVLQFAFVVAFLYFFWVVIGWLKVKKVPQ
jgi:hypothetical protein